MCIRDRRISALEIVDSCLARIKARDPELTCFTHVSEKPAREHAAEIDARLLAGHPVGALAGVPFAVKDLFDIGGQTTTAGAKLRENEPAATADADLVARLKSADAICIGRLNMDEFAYGFATVNAHYGTTKNPYDTSRLAGGSSGGSAAAVAASLVPITLGSDTNGSVRVPASLCGLFGLRPTHNSLPMKGVFPFVEQLDTVGAFTQTIEDTATAHRVLADTSAPRQQKRAFKVARLGGWFRSNGDPDGNAGVDVIGTALGGAPLIDLPMTKQVRSAAFLITAKYGGLLHLDTLRDKAMEYDPAVRDRLIAGIALSDEKVDAAKACIAQFNAHIQDVLAEYDLLLAPSTPSVAPRISDGMIEIDGQRVSARANLGLYTQPLSVTGLPILSVPLLRPGKLPLGIQLIANTSCEEDLFSAAEQLVRAGLIGYSPPELEAEGMCE